MLIIQDVNKENYLCQPQKDLTATYARNAKSKIHAVYNIRKVRKENVPFVPV